MKATILYGPGDVRVEERPKPVIQQPTDAVIKVTAARVKELTGGLGAPSVIEAVGTQQSMEQALHACRPGGHVGFVGLGHEVALKGLDLFAAEVNLLGGPAPVRRFLPDLVKLIWDRVINPGLVFDLTLPLDQAPEAYKAMDERRAIKALLQP